VAEGLEERILERINAVQDPCSLAQAIPIGLSDMGLVTEVRVSDPDSEGRHDVELVLRVTAPGCMYVPFMDRSIRTAVGDLDEVGAIATEWDPNADWDPTEIAEPARRRIAESRERRLRAARKAHAGAAAPSR
jgi:metal-sulfur cluster biosynthetic enzyme